MTIYTLTVGYNSNHKPIDVWNELVRVVKNMRESWRKLANETKRIEKYNTNEINFEEVEIISGAKHYKDYKDLTLEIKEEKGNYRIIQSASGGGYQRSIKEALRRAFCRLVLKEMHKKGMEINITVS